MKNHNIIISFKPRSHESITALYIKQLLIMHQTELTCVKLKLVFIYLLWHTKHRLCYIYLLSKPTPVGVEALPLLVLVYVTDTVVGALWLLKDFSNVNFRCNILLTAAILAGSSPNRSEYFGIYLLGGCTPLTWMLGAPSQFSSAPVN